MADDKVQIVPINSGILTGISVEELEDRLEMQMLGLFDIFDISGVTTRRCPDVSVTT